MASDVERAAVTDDAARIAALDADMLTQAEYWNSVAYRERVTAKALWESWAGKKEMLKDSKRGREIRTEIRLAEEAVRTAEKQVLAIRTAILGPNRRGAGKKEPVEEPAKPVHPATQALLDAKKKRQDEADAKKAARVAAKAKDDDLAHCAHAFCKQQALPGNDFCADCADDADGDAS